METNIALQFKPDFTNSSDFFENYSKYFYSEFYDYLKKSPWYSMYYNGQKYFFFAFRGQIFALPEWKLALVLSTVTCVGIVGIRKLFHRFQIQRRIKRRMKGLAKKLRGGSDPATAVELFKENEILHYEKTPGKTGFNFNPFSLAVFVLTTKELVVKHLVQKCLKPNKMYRIVDRAMLNAMDKMMGFAKNDTFRMISYDAFVLVVTVALKPIGQAQFAGTAGLVAKLIGASKMEYFPLALTVLATAIMTARATLDGGALQLAQTIFSIVFRSFGVYIAGDRFRAKAYIDCEDYVQELPQTKVEALPDSDGSSSKQLITYTSEKPTRHDGFLLTDSNQKLHYKEDIPQDLIANPANNEIETLDGQIRQVCTPGEGRVFKWTPEPKKEIPSRSGSRYVPLKDRTRTLADLKDFDTTANKESAARVRDAILDEQRKASLIKESLHLNWLTKDE